MARIDRYDFPDDLWYDREEHLWLRPAREADTWVVTVGVDAIGQGALGEVVYIQLTEAGREVVRGAAVGSLEAEKMVRPVISAVSGLLIERNEALLRVPKLLNTDPYGEGWLFKVEADRWQAEVLLLLHGPAAVTEWISAELHQKLNADR